MKTLRNIGPLLFFFLSVGCAALVTVKIEGIQRELPSGVLAVLEEETGQGFLIVEKEDGSSLYKNEAADRIQKEYGMVIPQEDLIELEPAKNILSQGWKLYLAGIYFLTMLWIWKIAIHYIVSGYSGCKSLKITGTVMRILTGILLYTVSIGGWYGMICFIEIPQQYLPLAGIWDLGYIIEEVKDFYRETDKIAGKVIYVQKIRAAGSIAVKGYLSAFLLYIPFWIRLQNKKSLFVYKKVKPL